MHNIGISEVKAKFAAVCDLAAQGEVVKFTRRRGSQIEEFELRRIAPKKRQLGSWTNDLSDKQLDTLTAPLTEKELAEWNT